VAVDQHPGDANFAPFGLTSTRVPMSELILFGEKLRPGQVRFMPRLAASMMRLRDYDDYRDALIVKKKIEACFAAFVIGGTPSTPLGEAEDDSETGKRTETLSPGIIEYVNGGTDVKFASPTTGSDDGFSVHELHAIAAGAGVTYAQLTGDLSQVNYSSIRAGMPTSAIWSRPGAGSPSCRWRCAPSASGSWRPPGRRARSAP
jgi:capsid protein